MSREDELHLLVVGDVFGKPGRKTLAHWLPKLQVELDIDLTVVNGENAAGGHGINAEKARYIMQAGADAIMCGNHVWRFKDLVPLMERDQRLLRPANFSPRAPGRGWGIFQDRRGRSVGLMHLSGRIYMDPADCPFHTADCGIEEMRKTANVIVVDFHAEATSEKVALGRHLDGRVTLVAGTHTHVQTADEQILPDGTAYITDLGMTGPHDGVIGVKSEIILKRFLTGMPERFTSAKGQPTLHGVFVRARAGDGRALEIRRIRKEMV